jgi:hypothetical protein
MGSTWRLVNRVYKTTILDVHDAKGSIAGTAAPAEKRIQASSPLFKFLGYFLAGGGI